jgi:serine/threonine-protein kinase
MHKHLKEPLTPPDHLNTQLTAGCGAMIERLMAKDREERYANAGELLEDLDLLSRGLPPKYASQAVSEATIEVLSSGSVLPRPEAPRRDLLTELSQPSPLLITMSAIAVLSVLLNIILASKL